MVFVSIGFRFRVEVEALNMVEPMGAYTKHRFVPVYRQIHKGGEGQKVVRYRILYAPAVSGQSINYGYAKALVELEKLRNPANPRLCEECLDYEVRGGFTKRSVGRAESGKKKVEGIEHNRRICECIVEDITGYMQPTETLPERKTSPVSFSYMVPDTESAVPKIEPQFHVRYSYENGRPEHAPFTIESGTAVYMLGVAVDVDRIGRLKNGGYVSDYEDRVAMAFKALEVLIEGLTFGAKKSRYLPVLETVGAVATISEPLPFVVSPPRVYRNGVNYIVTTVRKAVDYVNALSSFNQRIHVIYMDREGVVDKETIEKIRSGSSAVTYEEADTVSQLIERVLEKVRSHIDEKKGNMKFVDCRELLKSSARF
jgi:CRISPR-associated protein Csa2